MHLRPPLDSSQTGASAGRALRTKDATRTISDHVDNSGYLRNLTQMMVTEISDLHQTVEDIHRRSLGAELNTLTGRRSKQDFRELLAILSRLGFSWRKIAQAVGVSVPALRKWRKGGSPTGDHRHRVAELVALCDMAQDQYYFSDIAAWLETPIHSDAPTTALDMIASRRSDLVLRLLPDHGSDAEAVLEEFNPAWRSENATEVEVFTGPDGLPGLRLPARPS